MKRTIVASAVFGVCFTLYSPMTKANNYVNWAQGTAPIPFFAPSAGEVKNLYVDLVFWGWGNAIDTYGGGPNNAQAKEVMDRVQDIAHWLNTGGWVYDDDNPTPQFQMAPGFEPAVHSYGVSAVVPGLWVNDSLPIPSQYLPPQGTSEPPVDSLFSPIVDLAQYYASLGVAEDFEGNPVDTSGLPPGSNRLVLVITNGTNDYYEASTGHSDCGWHGAYNSQAGVAQPYGEVKFEDIDAGDSCLSHEIMEAMSDTFPWTGWSAADTSGYWGWGYNVDEIADECGGSGMFASVTIDTPYSVPGVLSAPWTSCEQTIPEVHAPMDATLEYGGNGTQPLELFYIDTNGQVQSLSWSNAGQPVSGPYPLGQLPSNIRAVGKPSVVYSFFGGGEYVFVKGSDGAVWMNWNGTWTSLGGVLFGDPKSFQMSWNNTTYIDTVGLGTDDNLYWLCVQNGTYCGWSQVPNTGKTFIGSPTGISRAPNTFDLFAVDESGDLNWMAYNISTGWATPVELTETRGQGGGDMDFIVSTPTVGADANGVMELFANGISNMWQTAWTSSSGWQSEEDARFAYPYGQSQFDYGLQGSVGLASWGASHFDAFAVSRAGELWWWRTDSVPGALGWDVGAGYYGNTPLALVPTTGVNPSAIPATGDPIAVSRYAGEVEVFYRTSSGQLAHMTYANGAWGAAPEIVPISMR